MVPMAIDTEIVLGLQRGINEALQPGRASDHRTGWIQLLQEHGGGV